MRLCAGQSSRLSIRARYTGSPTSCRSPHPAHLRNQGPAHIYAIKVLPPRAEDRAPRGTVRAARNPLRRAPCTVCAARTRTLLPNCRAPRKPHTPHVKIHPGWSRLCPHGAAASLKIPPRGAGQAAARRAVAERKALHPPFATIIYVQALASKVSLPIRAYRHPPPVSCA
jgi:hypothetical protein